MAAAPGSVAVPILFPTTSATACVQFTTRQSSARTLLGPDTETTVPKTKGESASLTIADFVSTVIRPGAAITDSDILAQATGAMDILRKHCSAQTGRYHDFCTEYVSEYPQTVESG